MKRSLFVLASLSYSFASYAAGPGAPVKSVARPEGGKPPWSPFGERIETTFKNAKSKLCMGVAKGNTTFGAYVLQGQCNSDHNDQWWVVEPEGPLGYHTIKNRQNPKMCLGVDQGGRHPRADIRLFPCDNKLNQKWKLDTRGTGRYDVFRFKNRNSDKLCIGVE